MPHSPVTLILHYCQPNSLYFFLTRWPSVCLSVPTLLCLAGQQHPKSPHNENLWEFMKQAHKLGAHPVLLTNSVNALKK